MKNIFLLVIIILVSSGYGSSQGSWQVSEEVSPISSYRGATAVHYNGDQQTMYVFGGWTTSSGNFNETSIYNFAEDGWSTGPLIPENTKGGSAVAVGEDIYLLTGNDGVDGNVNSKLFLKYNVGNEEWEYMAEYPIAARYVSMVYNPVNGLIYCAGGSGDNYTSVDQVNAYDIESDSWISCTPLPFISSGGSAMVHQGQHLFLVGGLINQPYDKLFKGLIDAEDPANISWLAAMSMPVEMLKVSAGYIGNGQILASELTGSFIYDISLDSWTMTDGKPIPVKGGNFASVEMDGFFTLAVAGGKGEDEMIVDHVEYYSGDENLLHPATFVVNYFNGGETVNAEIQIAENVLFTDDNGCAVLYLEDGTYDYMVSYQELESFGSITIDGEGVYEEIQLPVFIDEVPVKFAMYPNPSGGMLQIEIGNYGNGTLGISVFDVIGKPVYDTEVSGSGNLKLDLSSLGRGVYYVCISGVGVSTTTKKLIIH